ncbi:MAG: DAK2 domain-containing protein [Clostridia bacterium]|nr:DAK2 domain-containing protein [Clostridia bacterium]
MKLNGHLLHEMFVSAANAMDNNKIKINNMNIFPVPDGDTGINMTLTVTAVKKITKPAEHLGVYAKEASYGILRSARGNSGAILSLFFRGVYKTFKEHEDADCALLAKAFRKGTDDAYRAVMNPTEGTILTVMRKSAEAAEEAVEDGRFGEDMTALFGYVVEAAEDALAKTPDQLPVLKEVGVVDAGGCGFVTILNGMWAAMKNEPVALLVEQSEMTEADFSEFDTDSITYPYCTECITEKKEEFQGEEHAEELHSFVCSIGDSVVFVEDETIIKLHVHTEHPGLVLEKAGEYGMLTMVKIENMRIQHSNLVEDSKPEVKVAAPEKQYGFVAICMGAGITETFRDLGADRVIHGGQTMNPSTQNIIDAVNMTPAEIVYVLPNNKNIYMVAMQAAKLIKDRQVVVMNTKSVPQGLSAMIAFDGEASPEENEALMNDAISHVVSMSVTHAVRSTTIEGEKIADGQMLGLKDGNIECVADSSADCIRKLADSMADASFITLFYGEDVTEEEAMKTEAIIREHSADAELTVIAGGQPLYDYIISVE